MPEFGASLRPLILLTPFIDVRMLVVPLKRHSFVLCLRDFGHMFLHPPSIQRHATHHSVESIRSAAVLCSVLVDRILPGDVRFVNANLCYFVLYYI